MRKRRGPRAELWGLQHYVMDITSRRGASEGLREEATSRMKGKPRVAGVLKASERSSGRKPSDLRLHVLGGQVGCGLVTASATRGALVALTRGMLVAWQGQNRVRACFRQAGRAGIGKGK